MKKIVIFAGGTGSIALQTGFKHLYDKSVKVDVIISAYDNGKSTGECRKVFGGKILGPSDLRKNQMTQFALINDVYNETPQNADKVILYKLFSERFTRVKWQDSYQYAVDQTRKAFSSIRELGLGSEYYDIRETFLLDLIEYFFFDEYASLSKTVRKSILTADLSDFSLSNIFYASAAALNGNSLSVAGTVMAEVLDIPNNVHLISDVNLYLHAETQGGFVISDEGVIVSYDNSKDPISKVLLLDEKGQAYVPAVDEDNYDDTASKIIREADIIIFSTGTQWSSLIPTYMHEGFYNLIRESKAQKYLLMNNIEDRDMKGLGASDVLEVVSNYLPLDDVNVVINSHALPSMSQVNEKWATSTLYGTFSEKGEKTHNPEKIVSFLMEDYYKEFINFKYFYFDFDDTIWSSSKDLLMREISKENLVMLYKAFPKCRLIISGNSINHFVALESKFAEASKQCDNKYEDLLVYCNGGNCVYKMTASGMEHVKNISDRFNLNEDYYKLTTLLLCELNKNGYDLNMSNFENRGNCILSIKPLVNRERAKRIIERTILENIPLQNGGPKYTPYINGNTTIDIMNSDYNKSLCTTYITEILGISKEDVVYVGDKTESGNDNCIVGQGYRILTVDDVVDFNSFARTYLYKTIHG